MAKSKKLTRDTRIEREDRRLRELLKDVSQDKRRMAFGLIRRAAFLRVELEDLEDDINANGSTETYHPNAEAVPITRIRAAAQQYDKLVRSYTTVCRQLSDLVPDKPAVGRGKTTQNPAKQMMTQAVQMSRGGRIQAVR